MVKDNNKILSKARSIALEYAIVYWFYTATVMHWSQFVAYQASIILLLFSMVQVHDLLLFQRIRIWHHMTTMGDRALFVSSECGEPIFSAPYSGLNIDSEREVVISE